jgi:hypothetical protein
MGTGEAGTASRLARGNQLAENRFFVIEEEVGRAEGRPAYIWADMGQVPGNGFELRLTKTLLYQPGSPGNFADLPAAAEKSPSIGR